MKKNLMYVTMAAAALFASCSSHDDLSIGNGGEFGGLDGENVAIEIGVGAPSSTMRGTGTVGDVADYTPGTGYADKTATHWAGQKINVFMLEKGTMNFAIDPTTDKPLYENAELTTPNDGTYSGEAKLVEVKAGDYQGLPVIKYYPSTGKYDFWGYRVDDAQDTAIVIGTDKIDVTFTVDGTQDVLAAQTIEVFEELSDVRKEAITNGGGEDLFNETDPEKNKNYSASAARKGIQPELLFKHMMTRLTFEVKAGTKDIADEMTGDVVTTPATNPLYVAGIAVRPVKTVDANNVPTVYYTNEGTMTVAWKKGVNDPAEGEQLVWGTEDDVETAKQDSLVLCRRMTLLEFAKANGYDGEDEEFDPEGDDANYKTLYEKKFENEKLVELVKGFAKLNEDLKATDDDDTKAALINAFDFKANGAQSLTYAEDEFQKVSLGEAIIAPDAEAYELIISLAQELPNHEYTYWPDETDEDGNTWEDNTAPDTQDKIDSDRTKMKFNTVKVVLKADDLAQVDQSEEKFLAGWSYNFVCTVYGLEKIEITATLEPWKDGGDIDVDTDD